MQEEEEKDFEEESEEGISVKFLMEELGLTLAQILNLKL